MDSGTIIIMIMKCFCKKLLLIHFIVHVYQMQFGALEEMGIMSHTAYLSLSVIIPSGVTYSYRRIFGFCGVSYYLVTEHLHYS